MNLQAPLSPPPSADIALPQQYRTDDRDLSAPAEYCRHELPGLGLEIILVGENCLWLSRRQRRTVVKQGNEGVGEEHNRHSEAGSQRPQEQPSRVFHVYVLDSISEGDRSIPPHRAEKNVESRCSLAADSTTKRASTTATPMIFAMAADVAVVTVAGDAAFSPGTVALLEIREVHNGEVCGHTRLSQVPPCGVAGDTASRWYPSARVVVQFAPSVEWHRLCTLGERHAVVNWVQPPHSDEVLRRLCDDSDFCRRHFDLHRALAQQPLQQPVRNTRDASDVDVFVHQHTVETVSTAARMRITTRSELVNTTRASIRTTACRLAPLEPFAVYTVFVRGVYRSPHVDASQASGLRGVGRWLTTLAPEETTFEATSDVAIRLTKRRRTVTDAAAEDFTKRCGLAVLPWTPYSFDKPPCPEQRVVLQALWSDNEHVRAQHQAELDGIEELLDLTRAYHVVERWRLLVRRHKRERRHQRRVRSGSSSRNVSPKHADGAGAAVVVALNAGTNHDVDVGEGSVRSSRHSFSHPHAAGGGDGTSSRGSASAAAVAEDLAFNKRKLEVGFLVAFQKSRRAKIQSQLAGPFLLERTVNLPLEWRVYDVDELHPQTLFRVRLEEASAPSVSPMAGGVVADGSVERLAVMTAATTHRSPWRPIVTASVLTWEAGGGGDDDGSRRRGNQTHSAQYLRELLQLPLSRHVMVEAVTDTSITVSWSPVDFDRVAQLVYELHSHGAADAAANGVVDPGDASRRAELEAMREDLNKAQELEDKRIQFEYVMVVVPLDESAGLSHPWLSATSVSEASACSPFLPSYRALSGPSMWIPTPTAAAVDANGRSGGSLTNGAAASVEALPSMTTSNSPSGVGSVISVFLSGCAFAPANTPSPFEARRAAVSALESAGENFSDFLTAAAAAGSTTSTSIDLTANLATSSGSYLGVARDGSMAVTEERHSPGVLRIGGAVREERFRSYRHYHTVGHLSPNTKYMFQLVCYSPLEASWTVPSLPVLTCTTSSLEVSVTDFPATGELNGAVTCVVPDGLLCQLEASTKKQSYSHSVLPSHAFSHTNTNTVEVKVVRLRPGETQHTVVTSRSCSIREAAKGMMFRNLEPNALYRVTCRRLSSYHPRNAASTTGSGGGDASGPTTAAMAISARRATVTGAKVNELLMSRNDAAVSTVFTIRCLPIALVDIDASGLSIAVLPRYIPQEGAHGAAPPPVTISRRSSLTSTSASFILGSTTPLLGATKSDAFASGGSGTAEPNVDHLACEGAEGPDDGDEDADPAAAFAVLTKLHGIMLLSNSGDTMASAFDPTPVLETKRPLRVATDGFDRIVVMATMCRAFGTKETAAHDELELMWPPATASLTLVVDWALVPFSLGDTRAEFLLSPIHCLPPLDLTFWPEEDTDEGRLSELQEVGKHLKRLIEAREESNAQFAGLGAEAEIAEIVVPAAAWEGASSTPVPHQRSTSSSQPQLKSPASEPRSPPPATSSHRGSGVPPSLRLDVSAIQNATGGSSTVTRNVRRIRVACSGRPFVIPDLEPSTTYVVKIRPILGGGHAGKESVGSWSPTVTFRTAGPLVLEVERLDDTNIHLKWTRDSPHPELSMNQLMATPLPQPTRHPQFLSSSVSEFACFMYRHVIYGNVNIRWREESASLETVEDAQLGAHSHHLRDMTPGMLYFVRLHQPPTSALVGDPLQQGGDVGLGGGVGATGTLLSDGEAALATTTVLTDKTKKHSKHAGASPRGVVVSSSSSSRRDLSPLREPTVDDNESVSSQSSRSTFSMSHGVDGHTNHDDDNDDIHGTGPDGATVTLRSSSSVPGSWSATTIAVRTIGELRPYFFPTGENGFRVIVARPGYADDKYHHSHDPDGHLVVLHKAPEAPIALVQLRMLSQYGVSSSTRGLLDAFDDSDLLPTYSSTLVDGSEYWRAVAKTSSTVEGGGGVRHWADRSGVTDSRVPVFSDIIDFANQREVLSSFGRGGSAAPLSYYLVNLLPNVTMTYHFTGLRRGCAHHVQVRSRVYPSVDRLPASGVPDPRATNGTVVTPWSQPVAIQTFHRAALSVDVSATTEVSAVLTWAKPEAPSFILPDTPPLTRVEVEVVAFTSGVAQEDAMGYRSGTHGSAPPVLYDSGDTPHRVYNTLITPKLGATDISPMKASASPPPPPTDLPRSSASATPAALTLTTAATVATNEAGSRQVTVHRLLPGGVAMAVIVPYYGAIRGPVSSPIVFSTVCPVAVAVTGVSTHYASVRVYRRPPLLDECSTGLEAALSIAASVPPTVSTRRPKYLVAAQLKEPSTQAAWAALRNNRKHQAEVHTADGEATTGAPVTVVDDESYEVDVVGLDHDMNAMPVPSLAVYPHGDRVQRDFFLCNLAASSLYRVRGRPASADSPIAVVPVSTTTSIEGGVRPTAGAGDVPVTAEVQQPWSRGTLLFTRKPLELHLISSQEKSCVFRVCRGVQDSAIPKWALHEVAQSLSCSRTEQIDLALAAQSRDDDNVADCREMQADARRPTVERSSDHAGEIARSSAAATGEASSDLHHDSSSQGVSERRGALRCGWQPAAGSECAMRVTLQGEVVVGLQQLVSGCSYDIVVRAVPAIVVPRSGSFLRDDAPQQSQVDGRDAAAPSGVCEPLLSKPAFSWAFLGSVVTCPYAPGMPVLYESRSGQLASFFWGYDAHDARATEATMHSLPTNVVLTASMIPRELSERMARSRVHDMVRIENDEVVSETPSEEVEGTGHHQKSRKATRTPAVVLRCPDDFPAVAYAATHITFRVQAVVLPPSNSCATVQPSSSTTSTWSGAKTFDLGYVREPFARLLFARPDPNLLMGLRFRLKASVSIGEHYGASRRAGSTSRNGPSGGGEDGDGAIDGSSGRLHGGEGKSGSRGLVVESEWTPAYRFDVPPPSSQLPPPCNLRLVSNLGNRAVIEWTASPNTTGHHQVMYQVQLMRSDGALGGGGGALDDRGMMSSLTSTNWSTVSWLRGTSTQCVVHGLVAKERHRVRVLAHSTFSPLSGVPSAVLSFTPFARDGGLTADVGAEETPEMIRDMIDALTIAQFPFPCRIADDAVEMRVPLCRGGPCGDGGDDATTSRSDSTLVVNEATTMRASSHQTQQQPLARLLAPSSYHVESRRAAGRANVAAAAFAGAHRSSGIHVSELVCGYALVATEDDMRAPRVRPLATAPLRPEQSAALPGASVPPPRHHHHHRPAPPPTPPPLMAAATATGGALQENVSLHPTVASGVRSAAPRTATSALRRAVPPLACPRPMPHQPNDAQQSSKAAPPYRRRPQSANSSHRTHAGAAILTFAELLDCGR